MRVRFVGDPFSVSGYSQYCRDTMFALIGAGHNVSLELVVGDSHRDEDFSGAKLLKECVKPDPKADLSYQICIPEFYNPDLCEKNIGLLLYEADCLPQHWVDACNRMTGVITSSEWGRDVAIKSGVTVPVRKAIEVCNVPDADGTPWRNMLGVGDRYMFLSVFQWGYRKGWDALLRAYWREFKKFDPVVLVMKVYGHDFSEAAEQAVMRDINMLKMQHCDFRDGKPEMPQDFPDVMLITQQLSGPQLSALYKACDCFVLPTRGEGWGRCFLEAAWHGKFVVATDGSAHRELLDGMENVALCDTVKTPCMGVHGGRYPITSNFLEPVLVDNYPTQFSLTKVMRMAQHADVSDADINYAKGFTEARCAQETIKAFREILGLE